MAASGEQRRFTGSWGLLVALLAGTLYLSLTFERSARPGFVGDEATYLMAAESVAFDLDYRFDGGDLERFQQRHPQDGLVILQSGDGGTRVSFGKPAFYPLALAPFVRVLGERGPAVGNSVILAAALLLVAAALRRVRQVDGPLWVAVFAFASVAFGHVFWIQPDLFLMSCTAAGLALASFTIGTVDRPGPRSPLGDLMLFVAAGLLLAIPVLSRPNYLPILLAPALLLGVRRGGRGLAAGAVAVVALAVGIQLAASGSLSPYGGERRGFSRETGFPGTNDGVEWSVAVEDRGDTSWFSDSPTEGLEPRLLAWNTAYFFVGQKIGLLVYFLPVVVTLPLWPGRRRGWVAWVLVALVTVSFFGLRPFNFYGGAGALANRYFLPVYPLLWFALPRRLHPRWAIAVVAAAAVFLNPLWRAPRAFPVTAGEGYAYVSKVALRWLPVETTQRHLGPPQVGDTYHRGLWLRPLSAAVRPLFSGEQRLTMATDREADVLIGARTPLVGVGLKSPDRKLESVEFRDGGVQRDDSRNWSLELGRPTARHRMWWTSDEVWLYRIRLRVTGGTGPVSVVLTRRE